MIVSKVPYCTTADRLFDSYIDMKSNSRLCSEFIKKLKPEVDSIYNTKKKHLQEEDYDDVHSDVIESILMCDYSFSSPSEFREYITSTVRSVIAKKVVTYSRRSSIEALDVKNIIAPSYGYRQIMMNIYLKEIIERMVVDFQESIRFVGNERKVCLVVFNSLMQDEVIDVEYLEKRFNLDVLYFISYVRIKIRGLLYNLRAQGYTELEYLMS